jgi:hypothetical protein
MAAWSNSIFSIRDAHFGALVPRLDLFRRGLDFVDFHLFLFLKNPLAAPARKASTPTTGSLTTVRVVPAGYRYQVDTRRTFDARLAAQNAKSHQATAVKDLRRCSIDQSNQSINQCSPESLNIDSTRGTKEEDSRLLDLPSRGVAVISFCARDLSSIESEHVSSNDPFVKANWTNNCPRS